MSIRSSLWVLGCMSVTACASGTQPFAGTLPGFTYLDMAGEFSLAANGDLALALAQPCAVGQSPQRTVDCDYKHRDAIRVVAHTPWNQDIAGTWIDASHIIFQFDWANSTLD